MRWGERERAHIRAAGAILGRKAETRSRGTVDFQLS